MRSARKTENRPIVWIITVILSALLLFAGNRFFSSRIDILSQPEASARGRVTELTEMVEDRNDEIGYLQQTQYFNVKILSGPDKGNTVEAFQTSDNYTYTGERFVKKGDIIIVDRIESADGQVRWIFGSYARFDYMIVLGAVFLILVVIFGRGKGLNTILSLIFTCLAVFCVFIPGVLAGANIYLLTVLICVFTIVMTLILTNGTTAKSRATMLGCGFGVLTAAILAFLFDRLMHLTGIIDEHSIYLQVMTDEGNPINLRALIFAMITIGAMGAVMDVAMDIASSLYEVKRHAPQIRDRELFKSGMNIGRDVMGTMANTLVLAYIGSSLCSILLKISYAYSFNQLMNTESIVVELLNALVGSMAILLTIPLTAFVCCVMYKGRHIKPSES